MAAVILEKRTGYVNSSGELAIPPTFLREERFAGGLASVNIGTGEAHKSIADARESGFIDRNGEFVISPRYFSTGSFQRGFVL